ncbi:MAG TPA: potassium-transporting ATPase subunit KdpA [Acidimicrobiia bacterium]|nr:potassium-transporting ATPase subunit KdpA [Acidimicrobiia bacterium]
MTAEQWIILAGLIGLVLIIGPPLGRYIAAVLGVGSAPGDRIFSPVERLVYRLVGVDAEREQRWTAYALSLLAFSVVSILGLYGLLRLQGLLPFNPTGATAVEPWLAFNVAVSFVTNTNWQNYGGEATLSHLSQVVGLVTQNFVSAAVGLAVMGALIRGLARPRSDTIGNFWVDLTRLTTRLLLPLSLLLAVALVSQGVIQNTTGFQEVHTLEGAPQMIPGGPVASQVAIKQLGTNGGGFFNANSSHPFENPTGISNLLELAAILLIPFAAPFTYGTMVGRRRQGWAVFWAMFLLWLAATGIVVVAEGGGNPTLATYGVDQAISQVSPGGNMEGKEVRFGPGLSAVWAATTTATSNGSVNSMHDSYTPVGATVTLSNMLLGEVSPGGVGVGLAGMLIFVILTVFIAGLMVGRTPELLGKKIQASEMKLATLYLLAMPVMVLGIAGLAVLLPEALAARTNPGPWGLAEILYGVASPANNNGSAFAGLSSNTPFFNITQALAMLVGRFFLIIPVLAIAGSLVRKQPSATTEGSFPTDSPLFVGLLIGVIVIVAGLTFFPVLSLGPIAEALG